MQRRRSRRRPGRGGHARNREVVSLLTKRVEGTAVYYSERILYGRRVLKASVSTTAAPVRAGRARAVRRSEGANARISICSGVTERTRTVQSSTSYK